jgi:Protein of unknown function (DUF664)
MHQSMKSDLHDMLKLSREALVWKLEGASEYDVRRPLTATGTNLLGLVKHLATVQALYLGFACGRPLADPPAWMTPAMNRGDDLWVRPDESRESILDLFFRASALADDTVAELDIDARVDVPWVPFLGTGSTLHRVLVHVIGEAQRHLGHADIIREMVDGRAGKQPDDLDLAASATDSAQTPYRRIEEAARAAA